MALPAFVVAAGVLHLNSIDLDSNSGWLISSWITCAGSLSVIAALGGVALFAWLCQWVRPRHAYVAALGIFLGAAPLPYCTLLMSHGLVVGLLAVAVWAGQWGANREAKGQPWRVAIRDIVAGLCCGLALASEYSAGLVVVGILLGFIIPDWKRAFPLILGFGPPVLLIPLYNWICFGNPFTFGYLHQTTFTEMHEGFFGIKFPPRPDAIWALLIDPKCGLFFWSPFLLMVLAGYGKLLGSSRTAYWIATLVPILQVLAIAAYFLPLGGGTFGARLLAPILPLLALPAAFGIARFPRAGCALVASSIAVTLLATSVDAVSTVYYRNPLFQLHLPALMKGDLSYNLGMLFGLPSRISLLPLLVVLGVGTYLGWRLVRQVEGLNSPAQVSEPVTAG